MTGFDCNHHSHRRRNALTGEWVLVSPHRAKRPWQGQSELPQETLRPRYDPQCYLCPGNRRSSGLANPSYSGPYVFTNDFSALSPETPNDENLDPLFSTHAEPGVCRVLCFSADHSLTLAEMTADAIASVVHLWQAQTRELGARADVHHVQIFENKGSAMGCSNPHPHGQIWAQHSVPDAVAKEDRSQTEYLRTQGRVLLGDYLARELEIKVRVVIETEHFATLVPFWAVWPFETLILPKRIMANITEMNDDEVNDFARLLKATTTRYDNLFRTPFPYSSGIHQAPVNGKRHPHWQWHMHFYPPLLRSATVKKFMVGYEMLGEPQRDITPEQAAHILRNLPERHYTLGESK